MTSPTQIHAHVTSGRSDVPRAPQHKIIADVIAAKAPHADEGERT